MPLAHGSRLGAYEILSPLGAGGMGEVYLATDTDLGRHVAIKVLLEAVAADAGRLARFDREAKTLAVLNHPNIAAIYGIERGSGTTALVMELVEGPTLADRIAEGPLPAAEALPIARQIATALEAAHEQGIVHRDLKPANIKVRADGTVKVLDFGLAKMVDPPASAAAFATSPTISSPALLTGAGVILGSAAYMSPEQAKGRPADRRSDVWAFGVVLYEMLTGNRPFAGDVVSETLAAVLTRQPDWTALPAASPPAVRRLLRRCLEKDRTRRLADIADARLEIDDALSDTPIEGPVAASSRTRERLAWASGLVFVGLAAAIAGWATSGTPLSEDTTRTLLSAAPGDESLGDPLAQRVGASRPTRTAVALSPDGTTLVFAAIWGNDAQLYVRAMNQLRATPLPGTAGAVSPFFSPDGQWVGFWAGGELRKIPLGGGPPVTLCKAAAIFGASWGSDDTIVFASARNGGLWQVSAAGGTPKVLTTPQPGEYSHRLPHVLPDARALLFTISKGASLWDTTQIVGRSLTTGQQTVLIEGGADARYVPTGHLVFLRRGTLMAVPFDPVRLEVTGGATGVLDGVMQATNRNLSDMDNTLAGQFSTSATGSLVYVTGGGVRGADRVLAWVDRQGTSHPLPAPPSPYRNPRLSRDGQRVAVATLEDIRQVWSYDFARSALSAVTSDGLSGYGIFTPDGKRVVFRSGMAGGEDNLYWKAADGSGAAERLTTSPRSQTPGSWSPDGMALAFVEEGDSDAFFQFDIFVRSLTDGTTRAVVQTGANETAPEFSPDGRWLAYASNQSGRSEVYAQPYPGPGERQLISTNGGDQPAWSRDGRELFYVERPEPAGQLPRLMSVSIATTATLSAGRPEMLFEHAGLASAWGRSYDVAADGRQFLLTMGTVATTKTAPSQMVFVQNWFDELKRSVPTK